MRLQSPLRKSNVILLQAKSKDGRNGTNRETKREKLGEQSQTTKYMSLNTDVKTGRLLAMASRSTKRTVDGCHRMIMTVSHHSFKFHIATANWYRLRTNRNGVYVYRYSWPCSSQCYDRRPWRCKRATHALYVCPIHFLFRLSVWDNWFLTLKALTIIRILSRCLPLYWHIASLPVELKHPAACWP